MARNHENEKIFEFSNKEMQIKARWSFLPTMENTVFCINNQCWQVKNAVTVYFGTTFQERNMYQLFLKCSL